MSDTNLRAILKCRVNRIEYDFDSRSGHLFLPEGNCTDMQGAIEFFLNIDPDVIHIHTWQGGKLDTQYVIYGGLWKAI